MPEVFAEWKCRICKCLHRIRFELKLDTNADAHITRPVYRKNGIVIDDAGIQLKQKTNKSLNRNHKKSTIYADSDHSVTAIIQTVKDFIIEYYSTQNDTVNVDVCL